MSPRQSKSIDEKWEGAKRYLFGSRRKGNLLKEERKLIKEERKLFKGGRRPIKGGKEIF